MWYLDTGLKVIHIYQVIEYQPETCFEQSGNKVSEARLDAERNDACAIKSEMMKLLGYAANSKILTNKVKHVSVVSAHKISKLVNNPHFKRMSEVAPEIYEVEISKEKIRWNLPMQI